MASELDAVGFRFRDRHAAYEEKAKSFEIRQMGRKFFVADCSDQRRPRYLHKSGTLRTSACSGPGLQDETGWYDSQGEAEEAVALFIEIAGRATIQTVFDKAWQAFVIERKPPAIMPCTSPTMYNKQYKCCYATADGNKCAVGLCIPDGHRLQSFTGAFSCMQEEDDFKYLFFVKISRDGLDILQAKLHDDLVNKTDGGWMLNAGDMRRHYLKVGREFGLELPCN